MQTFADQAVIAIENVRLFREVEARDRDLTEALEQQVATSAILRAIAASPTDIQPVLDTVTESAARLCDASDAALFCDAARCWRLRRITARSRSTYTEMPVARAMIVTGRAVADRRPSTWMT